MAPYIFQRLDQATNKDNNNQGTIVNKTTSLGINNNASNNTNVQEQSQDQKTAKTKSDFIDPRKYMEANKGQVQLSETPFKQESQQQEIGAKNQSDMYKSNLDAQVKAKEAKFNLPVAPVQPVAQQTTATQGFKPDALLPYSFNYGGQDIRKARSYNELQGMAQAEVNRTGGMNDPMLNAEITAFEKATSQPFQKISAAVAQPQPVAQASTPIAKQPTYRDTLTGFGAETSQALWNDPSAVNQILRGVTNASGVDFTGIYANQEDKKIISNTLQAYKPGLVGSTIDVLKGVTGLSPQGQANLDKALSSLPTPAAAVAQSQQLQQPVAQPAIPSSVPSTQPLASPQAQFDPSLITPENMQALVAFDPSLGADLDLADPVFGKLQQAVSGREGRQALLTQQNSALPYTQGMSKLDSALLERNLNMAGIQNMAGQTRDTVSGLETRVNDLKGTMESNLRTKADSAIQQSKDYLSSRGSKGVVSDAEYANLVSMYDTLGLGVPAVQSQSMYQKEQDDIARKAKELKAETDNKAEQERLDKIIEIATKPPPEATPAPVAVAPAPEPTPPYVPVATPPPKTGPTPEELEAERKKKEQDAKDLADATTQIAAKIDLPPIGIGAGGLNI